MLHIFFIDFILSSISNVETLRIFFIAIRLACLLLGLFIWRQIEVIMWIHQKWQFYLGFLKVCLVNECEHMIRWNTILWLTVKLDSPTNQEFWDRVDSKTHFFPPQYDLRNDVSQFPILRMWKYRTNERVAGMSEQEEHESQKGLIFLLLVRYSYPLKLLIFQFWNTHFKNRNKRECWP